MNRKLKTGLEMAGIYAVFAFMAVIIIYPLLWAFGISLNSGTANRSLNNDLVNPILPAPINAILNDIKNNLPL